MTDKNLPATTGPRTMQIESAFTNADSFESAQRMAMALCTSTLIPKDYRGKENIGNTMVALEMAQRVGASPMAVMQNLHVIQGRPSWSSSFIIAALNSCGKFSPVRFDVKDLGRKKIDYTYTVGYGNDRQKKNASVEVNCKSCIAWAYDLATGDKLEGPESSIEMAVHEGWYTKNDSKWKTMPDLMLRYRAAAFFGRLYAPDVLMGMHSEDEVRDVGERRDVAPTLIEASTVVDSKVVKESPRGEASPSDSGAVDLVSASDEDAEDEMQAQAEDSASTEEAQTEPQTREYGKPAPGSGRTRRTKEEMKEDHLADEAKSNADQELVKQDAPGTGSQAAEASQPATPPAVADDGACDDLF